jgi:tetratricopeptide (TPR) repeat protein
MTRLVPLLLIAASAVSLEAQQAPRRPRLSGDADTNDAAAYFQLGLDKARTDPNGADAAFYWASRLDPMSPQSLYARGIVQILRDPARLVRYQQRDARTLAQPQVRTIDSLRYRAEMADPFFHRGMDELLLFAWGKAASHGSEEWFGTSSSAGAGAVSDSRGASNASGIANALERFLEENDPYGRGQLYYSQGDLRNAVLYLGIAQRNRAADWVWADRARAFMELRQVDSALANLGQAIESRTGASDDDAHHVYESTAAWTFALGRVLEDRRDSAAARRAYQRALAADPGYYPATLRLGILALGARDTAAAVGALQDVVRRPDAQFFATAVAATVLSRIGRRDEALAALRRGTEIEPWASSGWLMLGRGLEGASDTTGAVNAYQRYLALAPRGDAARPNATASLGRLRGSTP